MMQASFHPLRQQYWYGCNLVLIVFRQCVRERYFGASSFVLHVEWRVVPAVQYNLAHTWLNNSIQFGFQFIVIIHHHHHSKTRLAKQEFHFRILYTVITVYSILKPEFFLIFFFFQQT